MTMGRDSVVVMECVVLVIVGLLMRPTTAAISVVEAGHPDFPGFCLHPKTGQKLAENTTWSLLECGMGSCENMNGIMYIQHEFCLLPPPVPTGCKIKRDMCESFPLCCEVILCPQSHVHGETNFGLAEEQRHNAQVAQAEPNSDENITYEDESAGPSAEEFTYWKGSYACCRGRSE